MTQEIDNSTNDKNTPSSIGNFEGLLDEMPKLQQVESSHIREVMKWMNLEQQALTKQLLL